MADRRDHAVATAQSYHQGNIAGLNDAMTRRLIASTVMTESNGGDLAITNRQGYTGRYQAGASWLADAGYVNQDKLHEAMKGYKNEWTWASQGHMTEFLNDPNNWKNGLSLDKYKGSAELQDQAFKTNSDKAYQQAIKNGVLQEGDDPAKIAGFLKARHIAGQAGATAAVTGGRVIRDSNGTSNYDYLHDITRNRDGLDQYMDRYMKQSAAEPVREATTHPRQPAPPPNVLEQGTTGMAVHTLQADLARLDYKDAHGHALKADGDFGLHTLPAVEAFQRDHHLTVDGKVGHDTHAVLQAALHTRVSTHLDDRLNPDHAMYQQALAGVHRAEVQRDIVPGLHSQRLAAALVVAAKSEGLTRIDGVTLNEHGDRAFVEQKGSILGISDKTAFVDTDKAVHTTLAHSTAALIHVNQQQHALPLVAAQLPLQRMPEPLAPDLAR